MKSQKLVTFLSVTLLVMAILQAPFIYYYTSGLFAFFIVIPYLFVALAITTFLLVKAVKLKSQERTRFPVMALVASIIIGTTTLFTGEDLVENLDWKLRKDARQEIVEQVRAGILRPNVSYNDFICTLSDWGLPPISNGGNEIFIDKRIDGELTVMFYINRGFLDHYSAFVYTDDPIEKSELEKRISKSYGNHTNKKLEENWYRVSY